MLAVGQMVVDGLMLDCAIDCENGVAANRRGCVADRDRSLVLAIEQRVG